MLHEITRESARTDTKQSARISAQQISVLTEGLALHDLGVALVDHGAAGGGLGDEPRRLQLWKQNSRRSKVA